MPPIRRYLRITKYSVLEVRIFLDNPGLAHSWLLHPSHPVLPRIISSIRPWVLPKLREENERSNPRNRNKSKGKKKQGVKDTVTDDIGDFEVVVFLTDLENRHSLLKRQKVFKDKAPLKSNSSKLLGEVRGAPIELEGSGPSIREEAEDESELPNFLSTIPAAEEVITDEEYAVPSSRAAQKHGRQDSDASFVIEDPDSDVPSAKRSRHGKAKFGANIEEDDDKKKMVMDTTYDGFSIYGKALCLIVTKRDTNAKGRTKPAGQAMMEQWITSTQMPVEDLG